MSNRTHTPQDVIISLSFHYHLVHDPPENTLPHPYPCHLISAPHSQFFCESTGPAIRRRTSATTLTDVSSGSGSRLSPLTTPPCERSPHMTLSLQEILIVGSACEQAKFSELTMDMFRMLQTLEREPTESTTNPLSMAHGLHGHDASPAASRIPPYGVPGSKGYMENGRAFRDNPHKYLLYKPSISQLLVFLASGSKELPLGGALLLYMSADGCFSTTKHPEDCEYITMLLMLLSIITIDFSSWLRAGRPGHQREAGQRGWWRAVLPRKIVQGEPLPISG